MQNERTFVMIKPDGVQRKMVGRIIKKFEKKGFLIRALKIVQPTQELLVKHYQDLMFKPFFPCLVSYMLSGPVVFIVFEGKNAIQEIKSLVGETDPLLSQPGTVRGDFSLDVARNLVHASDSVDSAKKEIELWFSNEEISCN